jgi:hypothetical protein
MLRLFCGCISLNIILDGRILSVIHEIFYSLKSEKKNNFMLHDIPLVRVATYIYIYIYIYNCDKDVGDEYKIR